MFMLVGSWIGSEIAILRISPRSGSACAAPKGAAFAMVSKPRSAKSDSTVRRFISLLLVSRIVRNVRLPNRCLLSGSCLKYRVGTRSILAPRAVRIWEGNGADQQPGVWVLGVFDDLLGIAFLHDPSLMENNDAIADLVGGGQVVGDIDEGDSEIPLELEQV